MMHRGPLKRGKHHDTTVCGSSYGRALTPQVCKKLRIWPFIAVFGHYSTYFGGPGNTSLAENVLPSNPVQSYDP